MSKKNKKQRPSNSAGQSQPGGTSGAGVPPAASGVSPMKLRTDGADDAEPVAERRPVPVFLIILLGVLVYLGDMYVMDHGADVMGKTGPFPKQVFDPHTSYEQLIQANPIDPKEKSRQEGRAVFALTCMACHQTGGQGVPGQFPPLAGSEWVNAEGPNRIIRAVLTGLGGPITVGGVQFNNSMPPWKDTLSDEQIANVLTFVRSEWGNKGSPVTPEQVKKVRDQVADRSTPSSEEELMKLPDAVQ